MKIAVSSTGKDLNAQIDPRFGRCAYFIFVDTDDMSIVCCENENGALSGGAGIQAAGFVASQGTEAVLTGNCGPNAMKTFAAAGVTVYTGQTGSVRDAVERFKAGHLISAPRPTVSEKGDGSVSAGTGPFPTGRIGRCRGGMGRGLGMGMGRGMGRGRNLGMGMAAGGTYSDASITQSDSGKDNLTVLKRQAEDLRQQLEAIKTKIGSLEE
jgi:predicted Fe-Mo cluster-binding NifX family protein